MRIRHVVLLGAFLGAAVVACGESGEPLAPTATAESLGSAKAKTANAKKFSVDTSASKVSFIMDAPIEKIRGRVDKSAEGALFVDVKDLTQTTGNIMVSIAPLEIFQQRQMTDGTFAEETKNDTQNQHAKQWLEIDNSAPEAMRERNEHVEFKIRSIESVSEKDVTKMKGNERTVTLKAKGDFLLHGFVSQKTVELQATFTFEGENVKSIAVKTVKPFNAGLAEHDVRPRDAFGKLAAKTLGELSEKVAKEAVVSVELVLVAGDAPAPSAGAGSAAPAASESAAPVDSAAPDMSASAAVSGSAAPSASAAPSSSSSAAPKASASAKAQ